MNELKELQVEAEKMVKFKQVQIQKVSATIFGIGTVGVMFVKKS